METHLILILLLFTIIKSGVVADQNDGVLEEVKVGLVVDLSSIKGKFLETSLTLALSDFYNINNGYRSRVSVLARDSQGDPLLALASAKDLVKNGKVEAIVGAQSLQEAKLLAEFSEKAKVPVLSTLAPSSFSLNKYDHFIQMTHDSTSEAKGITSLLRDLNRTSIVVLYEDVEDWRQSLQILMETFQDEGINIARIASFVVPSPGEDYMMSQLKKLNVSREPVFVVHMSEVLVSSLFKCVEKLGLLEKQYTWILTMRTMNHFRYSDHLTVRLMQGVFGFRSYIPISEEVKNFTSRLRKLMVWDDENVWMETKHSSLWARDIAYILATSMEKTRLRESSNVLDLLEVIRQSKFKGLSHGDIQMVGNNFLSGTFEIVNMVGTEERRIGLWSCGHFCGTRNIIASSTTELETIIYPRESGGISRRGLLAENGEKKKLLRVLVPSRNRVPNLVSLRHDPERGIYIASGFCVEVFKTCLSPFNYELIFLPYNGSYDNLAYLLYTQSDKYDAAVGDITITSNRSLYVDFTLPYTDIGFGILTVKKKSQGMWTFFDPFETSLWLASGAFFILTGIVVWLVERPINPEFQGSWGQQLSMMLWFGFSTIVFAHREKLHRMSSRFLVIVWIFVVLILTSSYSANLTSTTTVSRIQLNHEAVFTSTILKGMQLGAISEVEAYGQGLRDGTLSHVINEIPYLSVLSGYYPDAFVMTDRETTTNGFGFMFKKGSGLATNVSREIAKLRSSGSLKDMEKRWFQRLESLNVDSNNDNLDNVGASQRFTFSELRGLFIIAGVAHAIVLALHLVHIRREIFTKLQSFY